MGKITEAFMAIAVADYDSAVKWYEHLMGRQPDLIPNDNEAAWQLSEKGWFYVTGDAQRAGRALLALIVDDLDSHIAEFKERGISFERVEEESKIYRRVIVNDPEGNTLKFTEITDKNGQA